MHNIHAKEETLTTFHSDEYIDIIKNVTPENRSNYEDQLYRFNFKDDCPVMERLYDYVMSHTTGSVGTSLLICSMCLVVGRWQSQVWHQLGGRPPPCQTIRGLRFLLH